MDALNKNIFMNQNKRNAAIVSSGLGLAGKIIPNSYFNEILGEDVDTWLRNNVQIYNRRWMTEEESLSDLCQKACEQALERADVAADQIDLIIVATDTPEFISPSTSIVLQDRMKMTNAATFDINTACAGFVTALNTGCKYIQSDEQFNHVLVVGAYAMSRYLNLKDKKTVTLFADGAAAVLLQSTNDGRGMLQSQMKSLGEYNTWMGIYGGGSKHPLTQEALEKKEDKLQFVKKIPTEINPTVWPQMIQEVCEKEGIKVEEVDHFFFTQININTIFQTMDALEVSRNKAATVMHDYGYTGSAAIPMAFDDWNSKGLVKKGDKLIFMGSGGGLAFSVVLFQM